MSVFKYVAVNDDGKTFKGMQEGESSSQVRQHLNKMGLTPVEINQVDRDSAQFHDDEVKTGFAHYFKFKPSKRVSTSELSVITYQFAALLAAGMPVEAALASITHEMSNPTLKQVLLSVHEKVMEGRTLADGMSEHPLTFPKLYVSSVAVGEKTGQLEKVLNRLADYFESQRKVREKVMAALIYPALLTLVAGSIIIFLLTYVIPQVTNVFIETGQTLPTVTLALMAVTDWLRNYGLYFLLIVIVGIVVFKYSLRKPAFRYRFHLFLLKVPIVKSTIISVNAARFSKTFGILFAAGVPVIEAMTSANSTIELLPMHDALKVAITKVGEGTSIHKALQQTGFFSPLSNQLIASGEASGELEMMLEKAASFQEQNTAQKISTALALFEPVLILTMGALVLFIVLAVLLPIFEMNQMVH